MNWDELVARRRALRDAQGQQGQQGQDAREEARKELRSARAQAYIKEMVDKAPPLTAEQRARLAVILRPPESCP